MAKRWKILCLLLALVMTLGIFAGCKKQEEPDPEPVETEPQIPVDTIDLSEYTVIYPSDLSDFLALELEELKTTLDTLTGSDAQVQHESSIAADSAKKEILIGDTNREESQTAKNELTGEHTLSIRKIGNKLVIVGHTQELVIKGLNYLIENYVSKSTGGGKFAIDVDMNYTKEYKYHEIVTNDEPVYQLNHGMTANNSVKDTTESLAETLNTWRRDAVIDFDNIHPLYGIDYLLSRSAIVVGATNYPRTQELMATAEYFSWAIETDHDQIYLFGTDNASINAVCERMKLMIDAGKIPGEIVEREVEKNGKKTTEEVQTYTVRITKDEPIQGLGADWSSEIPRFEGGTLHGIEEFHEGYFRLYYTGTTRAAYSAYLAKVVAAGFTQYATNTLEGNEYNTYVNDTIMIHAYYLSEEDTVSVVVTPIENFVKYDTAPVADQAATTPALSMMSMDYDEVTAIDGMGFVYTMADGSYVIIDGGHGKKFATVTTDVPKVDADGNVVRDENNKIVYETEKVETYAGFSERLFNYLKDNNKRWDGKILIRAWIMTNAKSDHYGCFVDFSKTYASEVELDHLVAQFDYDKQLKPDEDAGVTGVAAGNGKDVAKIKEALAKFLGADFLVPLMGQKIYFGTLEMNFLYTAEAYCHEDAENVGDHSLIIKAAFEGNTFLFTSDIGLDALAVLTGNYTAETLKSDFVQAPNHGTIGTKKFYSYAQPTYLLLCTTKSESEFLLMNSTAALDYLMTLVDEDNNSLVDGIFNQEGRYTFKTAYFPYEYAPQPDQTFGNGDYDTEKDSASWGDLTEGETVAPNEDHREGDYATDKDSTTWEDLISPAA